MQASAVVCKDPSAQVLQVQFDNRLELNKLLVAGENDATLNFYVNADCANFGFSLPVTVEVKLIGPGDEDPLPFDCGLTECP